MARSLKKGPFADASLLKKVDAMNASGDKSVIKTWSVSYTHLDVYKRQPPRRPEQDVLIPFAPDFMVLPMQDFIALRKETRFSNCNAMFSATNLSLIHIFIIS